MDDESYTRDHRESETTRIKVKNTYATGQRSYGKLKSKAEAERSKIYISRFRRPALLPHQAAERFKKGIVAEIPLWSDRFVPHPDRGKA